MEPAAAVGCPAAERGLLERRVRGARSTVVGSGSTLLREGEARVRAAMPCVWAGGPARLVCVPGAAAAAATGAKSSVRRGRLKRRSIAVVALCEWPLLCVL